MANSRTSKGRSSGGARSSGNRRGRPAKPRPSHPFVAGVPDGEVVDVPLDEIDLDNTEFEFRVNRRLKDLFEDIRVHGQQFPVILRRHEDKYQIVSGFRRCRTIAALEWPTVKAVVRDDLDDDMAYRLSFLENEKRKSLTDMDKANAVAKLRLRGKSDEEIQYLFGIGERQVQRYEKLTTFPSVLQTAIGDGSVKTTHALEFVWELLLQPIKATHVH